jgi:outer membrane protein assembly factor BamB/orotate phosphoribosyltransferase
MLEHYLQELKKYILKKCIFFSLEQPDFTFKPLKSGTFLFDLRELTLHPKYGKLAAILLWNKIKSHNIECLFGSGVGSIPLMTLIQQVAFEDSGIELNILICREERKQKNRERIVEGIRQSGKPRSFFIDDLINTGSTYRKCLNALKQDNIKLDIVGIAGILDFWTFSGSRALECQNIHCHSLFRRHDLGLTRTEPTKQLVGKQLHEILSSNESSQIDLKSPAVWDESRVYWATDEHIVYCYDTQFSNLLWSYQAPLTEDSVGKGIVNKIAIDDQAIYFNTYNGFACKLNKITGEVIWMVKPGRWLHSSSTLSDDKTKVYLSTESKNYTNDSPEGDFVCLNAFTGKEIWRVVSNELAPCTPYYHESKIYVGNNLNELYCLESNTGEILWKQNLNGPVKGRVNISDDVLCATSENGYVHLLNKNTGDIIKFELFAKSIRHNFTEVVHGNFVILDGDGYIKVIDKNLEIVWITRTRGKLFWYPAITKNTIIVSTRNGQIMELDSLTGEKIKSSWIDTPGFSIVLESPASINQDGTMIAVHSTNRGLLIYELSN